MTDAAKLTARQQQILTLIEDTMAETGAPPTRAEIAQQLGFRSPNAAEEHLKALARKGAIELLGGTSRGIRLPGRQTMQRARERVAEQFESASNWVASALSLPLVGRVAAGSPILAAEHIDQQYQVDPALFADRPDYLLRVRGMSMRDAGILDGDLLAVQKRSEARNGQIVVARLGEDVTVKRLQRVQGHIELLPENPDFDPIIVDGSQIGEFAIEGIAVGLIRNSPWN